MEENDIENSGAMTFDGESEDNVSHHQTSPNAGENLRGNDTAIQDSWYMQTLYAKEKYLKSNVPKASHLIVKPPSKDVTYPSLRVYHKLTPHDLEDLTSKLDVKISNQALLQPLLIKPRQE